MEDPLEPGLLLVDRFRVARRIAQGGMGVVYEAYDEKLGRRIALKCARAGYDGRLRPEVRLATEVSHPNICKIHEIHATQSAEGPLEFFTMELLDGPTLSNRLREDPPLSLDEAKTIARGLCAGLAEAHRLQIIHGDLKSANIILAKNPDGTLRPVITDFGLARAAAVSGATGGTRGYMAPELYRGAPTTVASDIYALGVILSEMVSRALPQERAATLVSTVTQKASSAALKPDSTHQLADPSRTKIAPLRSRWDKIIKTCLRNDPLERYRAADEVLTALGPSVLRRRFLLAAAGLVFAAVAALATYRASTAPAQSVKLDIAAVEAPPALAVSAAELRRDALRVIGSLKDSAQTAFSVRSANWEARATHRFSTSLTPKGDEVVLHAVLVDLRSGAPVIDWSADYAPAQLRYAPVALAGVVSRALHLPALTTYANVSPDAEPSYQRGVDLSHDDSKLDESLAALRDAAARDPDSALPFAAMAEVQRRRFFLTKLRSWETQAQSSFEQADLRNSDCAEVHRIAGLLEYDRNQLEQAIASMRRAVEFQPPHPDAFRRLGAFYFESGQIPDALQAYSQAERLAPKDVRVYQDLGNLYTSQSKFDLASKAFEKAVELAPDRPRFRRTLASSYEDQGRFGEAEAQLRTALRQEDSADTLARLGHVLLYEGREKEAIPLLARSVSLNSADRIAWLYLGLAYQRSRDVAAARTAFDHGLSEAEQEVIRLPRIGHAHAVLAYLCAQTGQTGRARVEAAQALQLARRHNETIWWAALTYERIGDRVAALDTLENAPRALLEDLRRWPEASALTGDEQFAKHLLATSDRR